MLLYSLTRRQTIRGSIRLLVTSLATLIASPVPADVIVLANRTGRPMPIRFSPATGAVQSLTLAVNENVPLYLDGKASVSFPSRGTPSNYSLDANSAYFLAPSKDGGIGLEKIGLGEDGTLMKGRSLPGTAATAPNATITVKILVDEEEPARQVVWEHRLRRRIEAASAIFEKYFHTKLEVVAVGTWNSDNSTNDFFESLSEFEKKVDPKPARVAIGFTSQWQMTRGRTHMAGTRGPFHTHILAREGSPQINEAEKLEFLIHELGHFFGSAHSPERESVMRPVLGDNRAGRANTQIQFDPVNTLAMAIISEEMRRREITKMGELGSDTRKRLGQIYMELGRAIPDDPAAFHFAQIVRSENSTPIVVATRTVVAAISRAALDNRMRPVPVGSSSITPTQKQGDTLTDHLVRQAARAAADLPEDVRPRAFLLGIVIGLDDNTLISRLPAVGSLVTAVEPASERRMRLAMLGEPTMRARGDLLRHFLMSALLVTTTSTEAAHSAGIAKELADSQGGSGFSFADLAADRAGIHFASDVLDKKISPALLGLTFSTKAYMPDIAGLPEKISASDLAANYGNATDPRFQKMINDIDERIRKLPGYQPLKFK